MDRLRTMETFVAVAEAESFAAAARELGVSAPSATRAIGALEARLGVRLFVRTTRSVRLTETGGLYLEECRRILGELTAAEEAVAGAFTRPAGHLRVTASTQFGRVYVVPILTDFLDAYPAVTAEGLFVDRIVNLLDEGIDVAVRIGELADSGLIARRVGEVRRIVCASPEFLARHGEPRTPAELAEARTICALPVTPGAVWRFKGGASVRVRSRLRVSTVQTAIEAVLTGWGITRLLSYQVGPELAAGRLCRILREYEPDPLPIHLVHPEGRRPAEKVRAFLDFAAERLRGTAHLG